MVKITIKMFFVPALLLFTAMSSEALDRSNIQNNTQKIIKYSPGTTSKNLAKHHDNDLLEMSNGKLIKVGAIRKLEVAQQKMRSAGKSPTPKAFLLQPAATGMQLKSQGDLASALKRPDGETVILPSGRKATVAQIKHVQPQVEKEIGRRMDLSPTRPNLSGQAIKITKTTSRDDWKIILQKPDSTVMESPNGKRITVGELKQSLQERRKIRKSGNAATPVQNKTEGGRQ